MCTSTPQSTRSHTQVLASLADPLTATTHLVDSDASTASASTSSALGCAEARIAAKVTSKEPVGCLGHLDQQMQRQSRFKGLMRDHH